MEGVKEKAIVDFYVYNNDYQTFKNIIVNRKYDYSFYVIMPHFIDGEQLAVSLINSLPNERLILLDRRISGIKGHFACVYEDFENNIYCSLSQAKNMLQKYNQLNLAFPANSYYSKEIVRGFKKFCIEHGFPFNVIPDMKSEELRQGQVFICLREEDLVTLVLKLKVQKWQAGKEIGIISYNETPFMPFILNGITTLSTDFKAMGSLAAKMFLNNTRQHKEIPFQFILRPSL